MTRPTGFSLRSVLIVASLGLLHLSSSASPASAASTITFVQVKAATPGGTQAAVTVTYTNAQTAGNLNVIAIGWGDTQRSVLSVTDSKNNVYSPAIGLTTNVAGGLSHTIYYAKNIAAAAAGSNTVTV